MSADGFPMTLWPGIPIPVPPVANWEPIEVDGNGFVRWRWSGEPKLVADELVLRELLRVDVTDADDVVGFVAEHGPITKRHHRVVVTGKAAPGGGVADEWTNHWRDIAAYLETAQLLTRTVLAFEIDDYQAPVWVSASDAQEGFVLGPIDEPTPSPTDERLAWVNFTVELNEGLKGFATRAEYRAWGPDARALGEPLTGLYDVLCLQLYNVVVEGLPIRTCANETCPHGPFVRQRGGAKHGQHHTKGVIYCTPRCASTQVQRAYRRKQRKGTG